MSQRAGGDPLRALAPLEHHRLRMLDLFAGIGGFSLAARMVGGYETVGFCEADPFCRSVLARHWPGVPCHDDVRTLDGASLRAAGALPIDVVTAGFPCQDVSAAGNGRGLDGARSGLVVEAMRIVAELRPRWVLIENCAVLRVRGLERVLRGLASIGYDGTWHLVPASAVGAPHRRDRCWIVAARTDAYSRGRAWFGEPEHGDVAGTSRAEPDGLGAGRRRPGPARVDAPADADSERLAFWARFRAHLAAQLEAAAGGGGEWSGGYSGRCLLARPELRRVADGLPGGLDGMGRAGIGPRDVSRAHKAALMALGNAVVPRCAALFLSAIRAADGLLVDAAPNG
jgi:DNA (cytosine-5)-methyltransferase 1